MSYILDALRKSQAERDAGTFPGLFADAGYRVEPGPPRAGRAAAVALLLLGVGVGIGLWQPWQRAEPPAARSATVTPAAPAVARVVPQTEARKPEPLESVPVMPATSPTPAVAPRPRQIELARSPEPEREAQPSREAAHRAAETPPAPVRQAAGSAAASAVPPAGIVAYQELPPPVREALPKFSLTGFAAVDETGVRLAFVNDRVVKEGDEVIPGVRLERVDADGMVLSYRGYRFRAEGR